MQKSRRLLVLLLLSTVLSSREMWCMTGDFCSWKGSGLSWDSGSRAVEQVHLRCTEGSLEWMYPVQALRVILEPTLINSKHTTICIKPHSQFQGANLYVEKRRELHLLVSEVDGVKKVHCFGMDNSQRVALFLQASPQNDLSRRTAGFQYELLNNQTSGLVFQKLALVEDACRPCDDEDLLMAVCTSDFVVRGSILRITHDMETQVSRVDINALRVHRQRNSIFQPDDLTGTWIGPISTLLQCRVKKGDGEFLFTGSEHFGDAWLGCAPRYKDFLEIYQKAKRLRSNPCDFKI
ncbi:meteorin-like protein isoform X1 [Bufo bufo]|uniref:meteorin-like protein isoform X1 n=1 Tax=Bufo bufo TaxID=8384 RepID=UPI001ABDF4D0|nr:meteorin-like protein isoform X1 [Bufo bufo]